MDDSSDIGSARATSQTLATATQLGQLLRTARKRRGLTQADVGARLGLSQNRVSHLEGHTDELSFKQLLTWCAVLDLALQLAERPAVAGAAGVVAAQPAGKATDNQAEW